MSLYIQSKGCYIAIWDFLEGNLESCGVNWSNQNQFAAVSTHLVADVSKQGSRVQIPPQKELLKQTLTISRAPRMQLDRKNDTTSSETFENQYETLTTN